MGGELQRIPFRGGDWGNGGTTGVFALNLNDPRWNVNPDIGFRVASLLYRPHGGSLMGLPTAYSIKGVRFPPCDKQGKY
jgi:hypothetical protein